MPLLPLPPPAPNGGLVLPRIFSYPNGTIAGSKNTPGSFRVRGQNPVRVHIETKPQEFALPEWYSLLRGRRRVGFESLFIYDGRDENTSVIFINSAL